MAFLSQASHLECLSSSRMTPFRSMLLRPAEWSAALNSKGSERTCIRSGLATFLHCACTAHRLIFLYSRMRARARCVYSIYWNASKHYVAQTGSSFLDGEREIPRGEFVLGTPLIPHSAGCV